MNKYILITADFPPIMGGVSTYLYNIWRCFPKEEALIFAPYVKGCKEFDQQENLNVLRCPLPLGDSSIKRLLRTLFFMLYLYPVIRKKKINLICCGHPVSAGFVGFLYKSFLNISYCVFVHGGESLKYKENKIISKLITLTLINADGIIANSEYTKNEYQIYNPKKGFLEKLNPGVDIDKFNPNVNPSNLRKRLSLQDKKVILTVSRLVERKNHRLVINILPRILQKIPNLVYIIVGKGPLEDRLRAEVRRLNLEPYVIFAGSVPNDELPQYYNLCDIHIMLSTQTQEPVDIEGFGISFVEANSCGKPVVGANTGGPREVIEDGVTGILLDPYNEDEVFGVLLRLLTDEAYVKRLGEAGRCTVLKKFDSRITTQRLKGLLKQI